MNKSITIGMDMGDKKHTVCVMDSEGKILAQDDITNTSESIQKFFVKWPKAVVAMEAGTHAGWVSRLLADMDHKVLVGNPRKLRAIWDSTMKSDTRDAEMLARLARVDPQLLSPIKPRSAKTQADLAVVRTRKALVDARSSLISHARSMVKGFGCRISNCSPECFHTRLLEELVPELAPALDPLRKSIEEMSKQIRHYDKLVEQMGKESHPETQVLQTIPGVGPVTSLAFTLTLEDSSRFIKSRDVGPYIGLTPRKDQSGQQDKQLGITKAGDTLLRSLLVNCAQYIMGAFGPDSDLKRFGLKLASRGGKNAKRRAIVAVARKLAILMHRLWVTGETYDPFHQDKKKNKAA
jgi:transposase